MHSERTLGELLDRQAARAPAREGLVYTDRPLRYSYQRLREGCDRIARGLMRIGIKRGDHVALCASNVPEWIVLQFALAKIGAIIVPLSGGSSAGPLEAIVRHSDARALVAGASSEKTLKSLIPELEVCPAGQLHSKRFPELRSVITLGEERYAGTYHFKDLIDLAELVPREELARAQGHADPNEVAALLFVEGRLGVMLTHQNILETAQAMGERMGVRGTDRIVLPLPLSLVFGMVSGSVLTLLHGATLIPLVDFGPREVLRAIAQEQATIALGTSAMFEEEVRVQRGEQADLGSVRCGLVVGPCREGLIDEVTRGLEIPEVSRAYGAVQTSSAITMTRPDDPPEKRRTTLGAPLPGVQIMVVEPTTRAPLSPGKTGSLAVRGPGVMKGYYKMPDETSRVLDSGWFYSDLTGSLDEEGFLTVKDRREAAPASNGEGSSTD